jgi:hypothetical protein
LAIKGGLASEPVLVIGAVDLNEWPVSVRLDGRSLSALDDTPFTQPGAAYNIKRTDEFRDAMGHLAAPGLWMTILSNVGLAFWRQIPGFASTTLGTVGLAIMITPLMAPARVTSK